MLSNLKAVGPNYQLYNIVKHMVIMDQSPIIITLSPEPIDTIKPKFEEMSIRIVALDKPSRLLSILYCFFNLKRIVDTLRADIIHTYGFRANLVAAITLRHYKRVTSIREYPYIQYILNHGKVIGMLIAFFYMSVLRISGKLVSCSVSIQTELQKHRLNSIVIKNGVDEEVFYPVSKESKIIARQRLKLPEGALVFIAVGDLIERKNPELLLKTFKENAFEDNIFLLLIGDGPRRNCLQIVYCNSKIQFFGKVDNVREYLWVADYYISASRAEGLPNAALEALACGLPVCLSDIDPHKEILAPVSSAGVIYKTDDAADLVDKINTLVAGDYDVMSCAALNLVKNHYSAKIMSEKYQQLYYSLDKQDIREGIN